MDRWIGGRWVAGEYKGNTQSKPTGGKKKEKKIT